MARGADRGARLDKRRVIRKAKAKTKPRDCLRCDRVFQSEGPHNRLCTTCRNHLETAEAGGLEIAHPRAMKILFDKHP